MKKILSLFLVFLLLVTPVFGAAESENIEITYLYDKNFEGDSVGASPSGVTCWSMKEKIVVDADEDGNKFLKIEEVENESKGCYPEFVCGETKGTVILEFKINFLAAGDGTLRISMKDSEEGETGVCLFDNKQTLGTDSTKGIMPLTVGRPYEVVAVINQTDKKIDVYVDRRKKISNAPITKNNYMPVAKFRFQSYMIGDGILPLIAIDDVKIYQSEKPVFMYELEKKNVVIKEEEKAINTYTATDGEIEKYMKNTVALHTGVNKIAIDGEVTHLDADNPNITPKVINGRTLVPVSFISEAMGASVDWYEGSGKIEIKNDDTKITLNVNSDIMTVGEGEVKLDTPAQVIDGRTYVPVRAIAEALGKKVTYDKSGLIVLADRENFFDMQSDVGIFKSLAGKLIYDVPSGEELVEKVKKLHPSKGHPRIMADKARFDEIKRNIANDETAKKWYEQLKKSTDAMLDGTDPSYYKDGQDRFNVNAGIKNVLGQTGLMYQLTGDEKYAERGVRSLLNACSFKDWDPSGFLGTSNMLCAVAIGFDWLYDYMTDEQRQTVLTAIKEKGFVPIMEDYNNTPRKRSFMWAQAGRPDNWQIFCNGGGISLALAVCDEEGIEDIATEVLGNAVEHVKRSVNQFAPDGAWYEGPSYWAFLMIPFAQFVSSLEYAAGDTFGYMDIPGVSETGYYMSGVTGPLGVFNFHDCPEGFQTSAAIWYVAKHTGNYDIAVLEMERREKLNTNPLFYDLIFYDPFEMKDVNLKKDWHFRDTEVITTRSDWSDSAVFAGLHAGMVNVYHGHYDMGEFIIDGFGTRYAASLGTDSYDGNVAHFYRNRAEGHNTILVNPDISGGQSVNGKSKIERFETNDDGIIATLDMTSGYPDTLTKAVRGMKTFDNRQRIIIQDEIVAKESADIYWFMHTAKEIEIAPDGQSARIYGQGKDMLARLTCDVPASFSVMEAKSFETSPKNPSTAYSNDAYQKLTVKLEKVKAATITVEFSFVTSGFEERVEKRAVEKIENWKLDSEKAPAPNLTALYVGGKEIEGFKPYQYFYEMSIKDGEALPEIKAEGNAEISVNYPESVPGYVIVKCASKENTEVYNEYIIKINIELLIPDKNGYIPLPKGVSKLHVASVWASDHDGNVPENTLDGDLSTSWAARGGPTIIFDLGEVKKISYLGLAIKQFNNDGRRQIFNVYVSEDGENYETIMVDGYTSGTTLLEEVFKLPECSARYVKIKGKGSTIGDWTNITEASIYGE